MHPSKQEEPLPEQPHTWYEADFRATRQMGIPFDVWEAMDWREYDRLVWHSHFETSRLKEPIRDLQAQMHNMFAEHKEQSHEFFQLFADRFNPALQDIQRRQQAKYHAEKAHYQRMKKAGLITV